MTSLTPDDLVRRLDARRLVPVVVIEEPQQAVPLAQALWRAGLDLIEVTFRTPAAAGAIRAIREALPDMVVGAGTLLAPAQVDEALAAGAAFGVAPGFNPVVVAHAQAVGLPFIPGIATPTELEAALAAGCRTLKFFPAEPAGGVPMLKGMAAAYGHTGVRFMPTGGVDAARLGAWLAVPEVVAVGGTWFVDRARIRAGAWDEIEQCTREALTRAGGR